MRGAAALLLWASLSACSEGVGTGTEITGVAIGDNSGVLTTYNNFECLTGALTGLLRLSADGSSSLQDFTSRVQWSSSDPETVYVGDGYTAGPEGVVLAPGNFIGLRPGFSTISIRYLDLVASLPVEILPIAALRIEPQVTDVGEGLQQQFALQARLSEEAGWSDLTTFARWSLARPSSQASVEEGTGLVSANSSGGSAAEILRAELPACGRSIDTSFRVSPIQSIELDYEAGAATTLPLGYSEAVRVYASFATADSTRQNVSGQIEIEDLADDVLAVGQEADGLLVTTTETAGTGAFAVVLPDSGRQAATKVWGTRELGLLGIALAPETLSLTFPDSGSFGVLGTFEDDVAWPVTRHVTWSSDSTLVEITPTGLLAGTVTIANVTENATVTVEATDVEGDSLSATGRVEIHTYSGR